MINIDNIKNKRLTVDVLPSIIDQTKYYVFYFKNLIIFDGYSFVESCRSVYKNHFSSKYIYGIRTLNIL